MGLIRGTDVRFNEEEQAAIMARLQAVVKSNYYMWGDQQEEFQRNMAGLTGRKYAMTYSHVTLALEALFSIIKPKTVAVQGNQFPSDVFAAKRQGAEILWMDIDPVTMDSIEFPGIKPDVLIIQHSGGFVRPDMSRIQAECREHKVFLIEDASQAMGTAMGGARAGHWGDMSFISLSATKFLTTGGQGGIVLFDDEKFWTSMFQKKVYGRSEMFQKGEWMTTGWNGQMTETQAAVGNALFPFLDKWIGYRSRLAKVYDQLFDNTSLIPCGDRIGSPNWYKYPVLLPALTRRDVFKRYLYEHGVECSSEIYPIPIPSIKSFAGEYDWLALPGTNKFSDKHVCLPMHNAMSVEDAETVVQVVEKFFREVQ